MDTIGAVLGPALALLYLYYFPKDYKTLFYIAFIPGLLAVFASFFLKEKKGKIAQPKISTPFFSFMDYWKTSPVIYRKVVIGLLVFTLFNSSDVFLLLKVKQAGMSDTNVIGVLEFIFFTILFLLYLLFLLGLLLIK